MEIKRKDGMPLNMKMPRNTGRGLALPVENRAIKNLLYGFYRREVEKRKREFVFTKELKDKLSFVGDFLTTENEYYGLFMPGCIGNGKTTMLKAIRDLLVYLVDSNRISYCEGDKYPRFIKSRDFVQLVVDDKNEYRNIKNAKFLLIDDLGTEPTEVVAYGMTYKPFDEILDYRYELMLPTFISSNLGAVDIIEKYSDPRIDDRMKEMFSILSFEENSYR